MNWRESEIRAWKPKEDMTISEWGERHIILSGGSEEKGPLRFRRTPYMPAILNMAQKKYVETIVLMKPAQIAGTTGVIVILGYFSEQEPCNMMLVMADEDTADFMMSKRIQNMYNGSPDLAKLVDQRKMNKTEITLKNDAYIVVGWASSIAKLASREMRIMIFD